MDTVKISKSDEFVDNVKAILKDRKLDYLVIHHIEPDHSGSIPQILDLYPDLKIVGNKKTRSMLNDYYEIDSDHFIEVGEGDELDLGDRKLTFYLTAMVHWPESMVSYDAENKILFSQDIFGGFGTNDGAKFEYDDNILDPDLDKSLNLVRLRVNPTMPKLSNGLLRGTGTNMRTEIRRERTVELIDECFRLDDLKRWKTAENEMPEDMLGIKYTGTAFETSGWAGVVSGGTIANIRAQINNMLASK